MGSTAAGHLIILKLSGEVLGGGAGHGIDDAAVGHFVAGVGRVLDRGFRVGLVLGGGNIFRGLQGQRRGVDRVTGDYMGMLATVINALAVADGLRREGRPVTVFTPFDLPAFTTRFSVASALDAFSAGAVAIFAGGTGSPFFSTDSAAALRAAETGALLLAKGTKVDGVYDADPATTASARRYARLSFREVLERNLKVMDGTAVALARDAGVPVFVFDAGRLENFDAVARGDWTVGTLVGPEPPADAFGAPHGSGPRQGGETPG